ncbi:MAG: DUF1566 domain-containing protein [Gammaproteobacteria bacterium]|nr:DUF1566 domain-containing protein [Gammaproteobacteria bacterium]
MKAMIAVVIFIVQFSIGFAHAALVDNGNGTITDTTTGLMWLKDADATGSFPWGEAVTQAANVSVAGHNDWRLPELAELQQLYTTLSPGGFFNPAPFSNLDVDGSTDWYWSNTPGEPICWYGGNCTDSAYYLRFDLGQTGAGEVSYRLNVLPVRTAIASVPCEFRNNGDGTVSDTRTGLMWPQNAMDLNNLSGGRSFNVESVVSNLVYAGYSDWRLPTIDELQGLDNIFRASGEFNAAPFEFIITGYTDWRWAANAKNDSMGYDFETGQPYKIPWGGYNLPVRQDVNLPLCQ